MAARRIKATINSSYVQPLKLQMGNIVLSMNNHYNSILTRQSQSKPSYELDLWTKFAANTFDGIQIQARLLRNKEEIVEAKEVIFSIYSISTDNLWTKTLLYTSPGSQQSDGTFTLLATGTNLGPSVDLDGEITLFIEARSQRLKKQYYCSKYFNHLGCYDSIVRLRQETEFLFVTKKDE